MIGPGEATSGTPPIAFNIRAPYAPLGFAGPRVIKVSSVEFQRNIGRYQDLALTQTVAVTRNSHDRQVLTLQDFTIEDIAALEATRAPDGAKVFDSELP